MELASWKSCRDITNEKRWIKEYAVLHIDLQARADKMEYCISPIFTNLLKRLKGLEGVPKEGFNHHTKDRPQYLEESLL